MIDPGESSGPPTISLTTLLGRDAFAGSRNSFRRRRLLCALLSDKQHAGMSGSGVIAGHRNEQQMDGLFDDRSANGVSKRTVAEGAGVQRHERVSVEGRVFCQMVAEELGIGFDRLGEGRDRDARGAEELPRLDSSGSKKPLTKTSSAAASSRQRNRPAASVTAREGVS